MFKIVLSVVVLIFVMAMRSSQLNEDDMITPKRDMYSIHGSCLNVLRRQVNLEMHASLVYMNMAAYFNNPNVARHGYSKFYSHNSLEEREHAQKIIDYVNRRGGFMGKIEVESPARDSWNSLSESLEYALDLENKINSVLHTVHYKAEYECKDAHLMDFIEAEYLDEQIDSIHHLKSLISKLKKMDAGIGEYMMDNEMMEKMSKK